MNIVLECEVTLSKKIEAICESGEPVSIFVSSISGNKGRAIMRMVCKDGTTNDTIAKIGETSLQFRVVGASEDSTSLKDSARFSNLLSSTGGGLPQSTEKAIAQTTPDTPQGEPHPMSAKTPDPLAGVTGNPETIKLLTALLAAAGVNIPPQTVPAQQPLVPPSVPQPPRQVPPQARPVENCIKSYDELMTEISGLPGIDQDLRFPTDRKLTKAEADQMLSRMPRLRRKAYIRNTMQSQLLVGDLYTSLDGTGPCLAMLPGQAFDLTRVPAKNILNSNDFKWALETGKIAFVGLAEYAASFKKLNEDAARWGAPELKVYGGETARTAPTDPSGGVAESLAAGAAMTDDGSIVQTSSADADPIVIPTEASSGTEDAPPPVPYEESPQMQALLNQLPSSKPTSAPRRMR